MLTNFFSTTKPVNSVFIILLFACYTVASYYTGNINNLNFGFSLWFLLLFGLVNFVNSRNGLTFDNSFFFLIFVILLGYFPSVLKIDNFFYSNLVLVIYLRRVYSLQSKKNVIKKLFDSGLWIGVSFLIEPFSIVFFPLTFLSITMYQHIDFRRLFAPILGSSVPLILYFTYLFWYNNTDEFLNLFTWSFTFDFTIYDALVNKLLLSFSGLLTFIALTLKSPKALAVKNLFRKSWILIFFHFITAILLVILVQNRTGSEILYLLFPSALIIANGFELFQKKWFADFILLLIFSGSILVYFL